MADNHTDLKLNLHREHQVPFCKPFVCTLSNGTDKVVLWNCVPGHCKSNILVFLGVIVMLAAMTIVFNCLILGINLAAKTRRIRRRNPTMSNYSVYVVSLAIADLLVGILVLPLCLVNFYLEFMVNELNGTPKSAAQGHQGLNVQSRIVGTPGKTASTQPMEIQVAQEHDATEIVRATLGVFTHLTLFVSIYTLITASADRLFAATYSARFSSQLSKSSTDKTKTTCLRQTLCSMRRSTIAVCIVWMLGIVFAILPVVMNGELHFRHIGHIFAAMTSDRNYNVAVRGYFATLMLPLIGIWILNFAICFALWRRKSQLGLLRKKSLRRSHSSNLSRSRPSPSPRLLSNSDSVFEPNPVECYVIQKYPASRWSRNASANDDETRLQFNSPHPIYRKNPINASETGIRSPASSQSQLTQWESRSSVLRRKVSSIRRAKEILQKQSYEANITKTLCIVVIAFTVAVLPLIITLNLVSVENYSTPKTLNGEVTALTLSLLLLFSNSFVNCVIYGARMRDFRTSLCQLFRTFVDNIKNTFCCCCINSKDSFASEVVNGVFLVTKNHRADATQSPSLARSGGTFERLKFFSRASSRKSLNRDANLDKTENSSKDSIEPSASLRKNFYPLSPLQFQPKVTRNARPSSSGYRTDPDPNSTQEDESKNRNSQRSDVGETIREDPATEDATTSCRAVDGSSPQARESVVVNMAPGEPNDRSTPQLNDDTEVDLKTSADDVRNEGCFDRESPHKRSDFDLGSEKNETISTREGVPDTFIAEDGYSRDSELDRSVDLTLDIDFSQFSTL